jgi:hypothetical protein
MDNNAILVINSITFQIRLDFIARVKMDILVIKITDQTATAKLDIFAQH